MRQRDVVISEAFIMSVVRTWYASTYEADAVILWITKADPDNP